MKDELFKPYLQNDILLLPPALGELVEANHPVRVVNDIIDALDLSFLIDTYKGGGAPSYHPKMLLKVIVYAYLCNIYSGRQMERELKENIHFMWLSGMARPDFRTINLFRSKRLGKGNLEKIFVQVVELLNAEGLVSLDVQYIDGTKIESVANKYTFVWRGTVEKNRARLQKKVKIVLEQANQQLVKEEQESIPNNDLTVQELQEKTERILEKVQHSNNIDKKVKKKLIKELNVIKDEKVSKLSTYDNNLRILGERNSFSKTDTEATFLHMKEDAMRNGQTKPGYNVQIATENQYITHYDIFWRPTDTGTLIPFLQSFYNTYNKTSKEIVADSGYGSEENYKYLFDNNMVPYVKFNMFHYEQKRKYKNNPFITANFKYDNEKDEYICPNGQRLSFVETRQTKSDLNFTSTISLYRAKDCSSCPFREECYKGHGTAKTMQVNYKLKEYKEKVRELLNSEKGLEHRSKRPIEVESVFGNIKFNHGFKRFKLKSRAKVKIEFGLVALAHNLRKYANAIINQQEVIA